MIFLIQGGSVIKIDGNLLLSYGNDNDRWSAEA